MGRWTSWRLVASGNEWNRDDFDHDGAACYELAIAGPRGGRLRIVYLGETKNERVRISTYGRDGSHLSKIISWHLREGWSLYYRGYAVASKTAAVTMQNRMLDQFEYDWNIQLNS